MRFHIIRVFPCPGWRYKVKWSFLRILPLLILTACATDVTPLPTRSPSPVPSPTTLIIPPTQTSASTPTESVTGCANGNPNIRIGPGTQFESEGLLSSGTCGIITERSGDALWVHIQTTNLTGWVFAEYIRIAGGVTEAILPGNNTKPSPNDPVPTVPEPSVETAGCPFGCTYQRPGCDIKGSIAYDIGERIYHIPGQTFYNVTVININAGDRWFCTESEAHANGWRKAEN